MTERWVALLRGINVGGANRLKMADLRTTMGVEGATGVESYLQSGNVVFDHPATDPGELATAISTAIESRQGLSVPVVVRTGAEFGRAAVAHPDDGVTDPKFLHVVFFDRAPSDEATAAIDTERFEPDRFSVDGREAYVTYPEGSARSRLTIDVFERAFGVTATARNMNSVRKLAALANGPIGDPQEKV